MMELSFSKAEEYILTMSDEYLMSLLPIIQKRVDEGVEFRKIIKRDYKPPSDFKPIKGSKVKYRTLDEVKVALAMTDKDCGVTFLNMYGKFDYSTVIAEVDAPPLVHKWTKDLFEYYWEKAQPIKTKVK